MLWTLQEKVSMTGLEIMKNKNVEWSMPYQGFDSRIILPPYQPKVALPMMTKSGWSSIRHPEEQHIFINGNKKDFE